MQRFLLGFLPLGLAGSPTTTAMMVGAPALLSKSKFDERWAETKQQVENGLISKEAGETNYSQMLHTVDRNHSDPPPVDPAIYDFGSFADNLCELTKSIESGTASPNGGVWLKKA
jgi:hypothetical protein